MSRDLRYNKLASLLCKYSVKLKKSDNVLLDMYDVPETMVEALLEESAKLGANPFLQLSNARVSRKLALVSSEERIKLAASLDFERIKKMQAYIAIRGANNIFESGDIPHDKVAQLNAANRASIDWRVQKTKWVVLRWPTPSMAQQAGMSTEAFEDFYFDVCTFDYSRFIPGMSALKKLMEKTDKVHIKGEGTDLQFSIKGIPAIPCAGEMNIPDGEVFTAPVKNSVEGFVTYTVPTVYQGTSFDKVRLEFKKGKIVSASASSNVEKLNKILTSDKGAAYIGEFALGVNPLITKPMNDILFDEKIAGSFHFTPGQAYQEADNKNRSKIHWDMVCVQTPEYGGGEIYFDNKLIRKDGLFVPPALKKLNPNELLKK